MYSPLFEKESEAWGEKFENKYSLKFCLLSGKYLRETMKILTLQPSQAREHQKRIYLPISSDVMTHAWYLQCNFNKINVQSHLFKTV